MLAFPFVLEEHLPRELAVNPLHTPLGFGD
jgi:hypothetical protein